MKFARFGLATSTAAATFGSIGRAVTRLNIMAGIASPHDCALFGEACTPDTPVGACMVSAEGTCRIWHQYGGQPDLRQIRRMTTERGPMGGDR